jgi:hypothetical protein
MLNACLASPSLILLNTNNVWLFNEWSKIYCNDLARAVVQWKIKEHMADLLS